MARMFQNRHILSSPEMHLRECNTGDDGRGIGGLRLQSVEWTYGRHEQRNRNSLLGFRHDCLLFLLLRRLFYSRRETDVDIAVPSGDATRASME